MHDCASLGRENVHIKAGIDGGIVRARRRASIAQDHSIGGDGGSSERGGGPRVRVDGVSPRGESLE